MKSSYSYQGETGITNLLFHYPMSSPFLNKSQTEGIKALFSLLILWLQTVLNLKRKMEMLFISDIYIKIVQSLEVFCVKIMSVLCISAVLYHCIRN